MSDSITKDKSSFTGLQSSNKEKTHSYRGNNNKKPRSYNPNGRSYLRNGGISQNEPVREAGPPVDLSDITLTEEEKKALDLKNLKSKDIHSLTKLAHKLKIENPGILKRQDMVV